MPSGAPPTERPGPEAGAPPAPAAPDAPAAAHAAPEPRAPAPAPADEGAWLDRMPGWAVPALLLGAVALVWVATLVQPSLYADFVWKYYWGPIKADAQNAATLTYAGVEAHSGYNVVNTASWAVLLGLGILGIAKMLRRFRQPMDELLIVGATAWVVAGSLFHVLEDTGLFATPLQYLFITPPIYLLFAAFGILSFLDAQYLRAVERRAGLEAALQKLWFHYAIGVILYLFAWIQPWGQATHYVNPLLVALFAAAGFMVTRAFLVQRGRIDAGVIVLGNSVPALLLAVAYLLMFQDSPWSPTGDSMPQALWVAPLLALGAVLAVAAVPGRAWPGVLTAVLALVGGVVATVAIEAVLRTLGIADLGGAQLVAVAAVAALAFVPYTRRKAALPAKQDAGVRAAFATAFRRPVNLLIVFAQTLDGFATALGIDLTGYSEKHVLSAKVIDVGRGIGEAEGWSLLANYPTFLAFVPLKLAISLVVIYAIDVSGREDAQRHPVFIGLVKFAIVMVGIGPGVRDFVRLAIGV